MGPLLKKIPEKLVEAANFVHLQPAASLALHGLAIYAAIKTNKSILAALGLVQATTAFVQRPKMCQHKLVGISCGICRAQRITVPLTLTPISVWRNMLQNSDHIGLRRVEE